MNTKFKTHVSVLLVVFVLGALYGAFWNDCVSEAPTFTSPVRVEDLAKSRMSETKSAPLPVNVQGAGNSCPAR